MSNRSNKKKQSYLQIDVSDDTDVENENDPLTKRKEEDKETATPATEEKPKTFCQWLFSNPFSKGPFLYFLVGILASAGNGVFYLMDNDTAFIISGILGASICFYALKHFYTLLGLKATIDQMSTLNLRFTGERKKLSFEIGRITKANTQLRETHNRLLDVNERNRESLDQFRTIQDNMNKFGKDSIAGMTDLLGKSKAIESKWHDQLYEHERNLLHTVFERMEQRQGSRMGMNAEQFKEFENQLPQEYKHRFDRMGTFHHLAKGQSLIQYDDFRCVLDVFAEMATDNVDIEFEIQKTATPRSKHKKKQSKQQVKFRSMDPVQEDYNEESSFQFKKFEPNNVSNIGKLKEVESIDLEDIKFDEDDDDAPQLYDRKVVRTKRTIRGSRFREDLSIAALMDDDIDYGSGSGSGSDHDNNARESMFGQEIDTPTSGIELDKRKFKVPGQSNDKSKVKLNTHGRKKFASLLDDVDNQ